MNAKLKQVKFEDMGVNTTFLVQHGEAPARWCSKIDDSRFIYIAENGSHHPKDLDAFFIEVSE